MPWQDPMWFRVLQLTVPGLIAGAAAVIGVLIGNSGTRRMAHEERRERAAQRRQRMLEPLYMPMFRSYSEMHDALVRCQEALSKYCYTRERADLRSAQGLQRLLRRNALWLTPAAGKVLFDAAEEIHRFCSVPSADASAPLAMITKSQQVLRKELGVEGFLQAWQEVLST